jgi:hypothetical protein
MAAFVPQSSPRFTGRPSLGEIAGMGRVLTEATFEEWIEFVFARPVTDPAWFWEDAADRWAGSPTVTVERLAETFERSAEVLEPYDDEQVAQGLLYLTSAVTSDISGALLDESVPLDLRERAWESMVTLFRDGFAFRCSNHLSHLEPIDANPLNIACFRWWSVYPVEPAPEDPAAADRDDLVLSVLERIVDLPSDSCRESALRGLARWEPAYPDRVHDIIDRFIWANRNIRLPLRTYAYAARHGDVA